MYENFCNKLSQLDFINLNFNSSGLMIMNITIAFVMFGVALDIKTENFKKIGKHPKSIITGVLSQFLLLPGITFLLIIIAKLPVSISLGMLLVASCPGGNISNFITSLAKGNIELSVSLTAISDLSSIIMTPLNFTLWGNLYLETLPLVNPIEIPFMDVLKTITLLMGVPLAAGMIFSYKFPKTTKMIFKPIKIISILAFFGFIAGALGANLDNFLKYALLIFPVVLIHNLIALSTGYSVSRLVRLNKKNQKTITIETGIQNSGIALVLIFNKQIFPDGYGGVGFITALWGIWHIASGLIIAAFWSRKSNKKKVAVSL